MEQFLSGVVGITGTIIDAFVSGVDKIFNVLVMVDATTGNITGPSVAGWFIGFGLAGVIVGWVIKMFNKLTKQRN